MQWLTAILAFATTMLIFAVVVSAIVETIHRVLGSRTFGLIAMLEHYFDEVLTNYVPEDGRAEQRDAFVKLMVMVRAPGISSVQIDRARLQDVEGLWKYIAWFFGLIPWLLGRIPLGAKYLYAKLNGTSKIAAQLGNSSWRLLDSLPVATFMERLGTFGFAEFLDEKQKQEATKQVILKDLAQKFELYGQESTLYFSRKARSISLIVALLVAWTFYVHPYTLIQTYLQQPLVAAQVAALSEDALQQFEAQKSALEVLKEAQEKSTASADSTMTSAALEKLLEGVEADIEKGRAQSKRLQEAGAPVGWPPDTPITNLCQLWPEALTIKADFWPFNLKCHLPVNKPDSARDIFWLLMGGLLIGLGAPFWASAIGKLAQAKDASQNLTNILQPQNKTTAGARQAARSAGAGDTIPITTEAFNAADMARQAAETAQADAHAANAARAAKTGVPPDDKR